MKPVSNGAHDRRLLRGAQSRQAIVRHAVDVASLEGLDGLSFGRLATDLGVSKGGIQTLFGTKENLQVAVIECAREEFGEAVTRPAGAQPPGNAPCSTGGSPTRRSRCSPAAASGQRTCPSSTASQARCAIPWPASSEPGAA